MAIQQVMDDLKDQGLIDPETRLTVKPVRPWLIASFWSEAGAKKISATEDCNGMGKDEIRFCLLHEYGHIAQSRKYSFGMFVAILLEVFSLPLATRGDLALIIFAPILYISGWELMHFVSGKYELAADYYAGRILQSAFSIANPSMIMDSALTQLMAIRNGRKPRLFFILTVVGYKHPSRSKRVDEIAKNIDENKATGQR